MPIRSEAGPLCPPSQEWALLAAGAIKGERASALLAHVADCESCGLTLRLATEVLADDSAVETPAAPPDLARQLAGQPAPRKTPEVIEMPKRRVWAVLATIAAALAIAVGGWALRPQVVEGPAAETLLAQAYTERRPFDFRIGETAFAPVRVKRGAVSARQAPLALAEHRIQEALAANPSDVNALQMRARAEMLEFEPESAIGTLQRALAIKPNDAGLLADLGSAYAQAGNWAKAHEALTAALLLKPDLAPAVFNRALVNEKREARGEAMADWERYLALDAASGWAKEAREHREALENQNSN